MVWNRAQGLRSFARKPPPHGNFRWRVTRTRPRRDSPRTRRRDRTSRRYRHRSLCKGEYAIEIMRPVSMIAVAVPVALAITTLAAPLSADAQSNCASATRASVQSVPSTDDVMSRRVSLHGRDVSLRDALDRLAAAARFRLSYSAEQLDLSKSVCLEYESAPVSSVLEGILTGARVRPVVLGSDQIVLTPVVQQSSTEPVTLLKSVGMLDR